MRYAAGLAFGMAFAGFASAAQAMVAPPSPLPSSTPALTKVEYFCSPGFEPSYGGTCVAVASRAEIELFVDQPIYGAPVPAYRTYLRHRRHRTIRERY